MPSTTQGCDQRVLVDQVLGEGTGLPLAGRPGGRPGPSVHRWRRGRPG
ncbi:MAG: hypothetical protein JWP68_506 [Modestobacter sp.]|jgi:hypothetical protein|nr:hypothetical protein [Modestobacter sp.]MCW2507358.1 hypothetical protein [Modestobacter sp.]MCW2577442.1 hypothetical protein [Modestobacter sp.]